MLLQKLRLYAQEHMELPPAGYQSAPVRYVVRTNEQGQLIEISDTAGSKDRGAKFLVPYLKRSNKIAPKLMADTAEYVLGIARNDPTKPPNPERVASMHRAFLDLLNSCAEETGEPTVSAVAKLIASGLITEASFGNSFDPSATISFRVNQPGSATGVMPVDLPSVRTFWAARAQPEEGDTTPIGTCIVCGQERAILERHPLKIKGIPGGQDLKDLISANAAAFESYGLVASRTAPTCAECAEAYGNALNDLLANKTRSLRTKELAYAFWADAEDEGFGELLVGGLYEPETRDAEIRTLLTASYSGKVEHTAVDETRFNSVVLGASGSRVVVKDWIETTVGNARSNLIRYFALQDLVDYNGDPGKAFSLFKLAGSTVFKGATPTAIVSQSLVRVALQGGPLPLDLLFLAVKRNRAEQTVDRARAVLIKMVLGSQTGLSLQEVQKMSELDLSNTSPAYLCGRLLATLESVQYRALGRPSTTIVDKFYGTASSAPGSVFGTLMHGVQHHLGKLRSGSQADKAAAGALERAIEEISTELKEFPSTLGLQDQGLFALGFYHQRAANRAQSKERRAANESVDE